MWGSSVLPLLKHLPEGAKFDLIILSDLIFNHNRHYELLLTCQNALSDNGEVEDFPVLPLREVYI